jgi:hypothetical protein
MATPDQLRREYAEGQSRFPNLVARGDPPNDFQISFPNSPVPYRIQLGRQYPQVAPDIYQGPNLIHVVLTDNWVDFFSLADVIQQLSVSALPPPRLFQLDHSELQSAFAAYSQNLTSPDRCELVISQLRCCQGLQERRAEAARAEREATEKQTQLMDAAIPKLHAIRDLYEEKRRLEATLDPRRIAAVQQQGRARVVAAKIDDLKREAADFDGKIEDVTRQLSQGAIQVDAFARTLLELAEKSHCAKLMAAELERQR